MSNHLTPILDSLRPLSEDCILHMEFEPHPTLRELNDLFFFYFASCDEDYKTLNPATGYDLFREWQILFACLLAEMSEEDLRECFPEIFRSAQSQSKEL